MKKWQTIGAMFAGVILGALPLFFINWSGHGVFWKALGCLVWAAASNAVGCANLTKDSINSIEYRPKGVEAMLASMFTGGTLLTIIGIISER